MDPAQELEQSILARHKPMIDAIAQGGSPVQQFYSATTVFMTGGSGFLGKQLVEKLIRSCEIKKIYMLLRPKKGKTIQQRLESILDDPLYDSVRETKPQFANMIEPVDGDVADIKLGLSEEDWTKLTKEVNVIFHVAATVRFDETLKKATLINVRGTREALELGKQCNNLKCFNHTSTAFAHATVSRINSDVEEKFYPSPVPPDVMIELVETVHEDKLNAITPSLIEGWPNTYTFTKALAEELIRTSAGDMPVCIVKPPVVLNSLVEPAPGWIDVNAAMSSPSGAVLGIGLGLVHLILSDRENIVSYAPVDYVNNAIITASWDSTQRNKTGSKEIPVYTVSTSRYGTKWNIFSEGLRSDEVLRLVSPKTVWYCGAVETRSTRLFWLLTWLFHYIPGYLIDALLHVSGAKPKGLPSLVNIYTKLYKMSMLYHYFTFNYWNIRDDNLRGMIERMSAQDRAIYNCDVTTIDYRELIKTMCIGMRKYIVKDELKGSVEGYKRQLYLFKYANIALCTIYAYLIYLVLYFVYFVLNSIVHILIGILPC